MRNAVLLVVSVLLCFGVYYGGHATAKVVSHYFPSCQTFKFGDGQQITGWHAVYGKNKHVVQLRTGEYAVFEGFVAMSDGDKSVDCDFPYVRPTVHIVQ